MTYRIEKHTVASSDGIHTLAGRIFIPEGEIKGIFHLVHGMTEYIGRYEEFFSNLAQNGYVCCGYDNLGHGDTVLDDSELGFIAESEGFRYLIDDVNIFGESVRNMFPDKKYYLMGHSMGSFIVRLAAEKYPEKIDRLIVCGTGGPMLIAHLGLGIIRLIRAFKGARYISPLVEKIAFGAYNKGFEGSTKYEWLTKDRAIIDKYVKDKYCTFKFTVSAMQDLITLTIRCNRKEWFKGLRRELPVLLIAGDKDPVGNYSQGVKEVYKRLISAGQKRVVIKLYEDCRHEILNDTCKAQVFADIIEFLGK